MLYFDESPVLKVQVTKCSFILASLDIKNGKCFFKCKVKHET